MRHLLLGRGKRYNEEVTLVEKANGMEGSLWILLQEIGL